MGREVVTRKRSGNKEERGKRESEREKGASGEGSSRRKF